MIFLILWIGCAVLGGWIGSQKNRTGTGVALGGLLGIISLIIILALPAKPAAIVQHSGPWAPPSKWGKQLPPRGGRDG